MTEHESTPTSAEPGAPRRTTVLPFGDGAYVDTDHRKFLKWVGITLAVSFAFAWGSIPLYRLVCAKLDPGGSAALNGEVSDYTGVVVDESRTVHVRFSSFVNSQLPWKFAPTELTAEVHPGEKRLTKFYAENLSAVDTIVGKGVYDIVPPEAAQYFKKIECFCFTEQTLNPNESMEMPLYFWFDPSMPEHITSITLSYTFFKLKTLDGPVEHNAEDGALPEGASALKN